MNDQGEAVYLVDPGINGTHKTRPDGSAVTKFDAPKATLMSYIIKGILGHKLPWALVLLGVMIAIVLEMSGIPSLAFAVGVYLPLSSSSPIFIGGMIRWLVDRWLRKQNSSITIDARTSSSRKATRAPACCSPPVISRAARSPASSSPFMAGWPSLGAINERLAAWATAHNPFFAGPHADLLALIPFVVLCVLLYLVGRDVLLASRKQKRRNVASGACYVAGAATPATRWTVRLATICQTFVGRALRLPNVVRVSIAHPRQAMRLPYNHPPCIPGSATPDTSFSPTGRRSC